MQDHPFHELVHRHFAFLIHQYGFRVGKQEWATDKYDSGYVEFESSKITIRVEKDRHDIFVSMKPLAEPEVSRQYLENILDALSVPRDNKFPVGFRVAPDKYEGALDSYARLIKDHCGELLEGNLSKWLQLIRDIVDKQKKDYFRKTRRKLPARIYRELEEYINSRGSI